MQVALLRAKGQFPVVQLGGTFCEKQMLRYRIPELSMT